MKTISILFLAASFVSAQMHAAQPAENSPTTVTLTAEEAEAETQRLEANSKRQEAAKKLTQFKIEVEKLNIQLSETKAAREKVEKDAQKEIDAKNTENEKTKLQHEKDLLELSLQLKGLSEDAKQKYKNELQEIELLKLKQEKENLKKTAEKSYTDHAWDIAEKTLEKSVETLATSVPTAFVSTTFQLGSKILETQITNSKRYRWLLLTDAAIKLNELDIKTKELHNSNTIAATDFQREQIKSTQLDRWLKIEEFRDTQSKKRAERMKHNVEVLALIASQRVDIKKEKGEYEEDLKDPALDAAKKQKLKAEVDECDKDRATLLQERRAKRKQLIEQIKNDTILIEKPEPIVLPVEIELFSNSEIKYDGC